MEKRRKKPTVLETCVILLTILGFGIVLSKAAQVAIPFMLAFLLAMLFAPLITWGRHHKIPAPVMVFVVLACLVAIFLPLGFFLNAGLSSVVEVLPSYYGKLVEIGKTLFNEFNIPKDFWVSINWYNTIGRYVSGMTGFLIGWLSSTMLVLIFLVFLLLEVPYVDSRLKLAFVGEGGEKVSMVAYKIVAQISKYLSTLAVISLATGTCVAVILYMLGINFAFTWGLLAFFMNFIPTVGSIMASIPPILFAVVQFYPDWVPAALTMFFLLAVQFGIGNIMTPKVMGDTLDLSPVVILISLLFWGLIWGISGALLSVPITVMIKIICENIAPLHFMAVLISSAGNGRTEADE